MDVKLQWIRNDEESGKRCVIRRLQLAEIRHPSTFGNSLARLTRCLGAALTRSGVP